ncbi:hypothetical protein GAB14E_2550 [Colwellia psychrerythraea]|uniref:Uncharacterized protein n=1 Tax=Colwellia psychrerythraea TaxID=28229 RepID=A0A099KUW3_COLPS|nr:hypothetical protein GAB14E_2550 [Colwellia psychrerythraea]
MNTVQKFKSPHEQSSPPYIGKVWSVSSSTDSSVMLT